MSRSMRKEARFWNWIARRYAKQPVADEAAYQEKLEVTRRYLQPEMEVLEFGCGTGSTAIAHAPHVKHILATDISANMIAIARQKAEVGGVTNVEFSQTSIEGLAASGRSFDAVLGLSVLHLLDNRQEAVSRVYDVLKPGGVFVSSTACLADGMSFFKYIAPVGYALGVLPLVKVFSAKELEAGLIGTGFQIDYQWQPGKNKAVFIVARKPAP